MTAKKCCLVDLSQTRTYRFLNWTGYDNALKNLGRYRELTPGVLAKTTPLTLVSTEVKNRGEATVCPNEDATNARTPPENDRRALSGDVRTLRSLRRSP